MRLLFLNIVITMQLEILRCMKYKVTVIALLAGFMFASCGPKPYYQTREGKKKQKYYNDIQFGGKSASEMKKP
jgi:hypothetical protein